jgi:hypothetical protein
VARCSTPCNRLPGSLAHAQAHFAHGEALEYAKLGCLVERQAHARRRAPTITVRSRPWRRGLGPVELARLAELVRVACSVKTVADGGRRERFAADRQAALVALRAWYEEWSELARACIKRRDLLQNLGLARRGRRAASEADDTENGSGGPADGEPR